MEDVYKRLSRDDENNPESQALRGDLRGFERSSLVELSGEDNASIPELLLKRKGR